MRNLVTRHYSRISMALVFGLFTLFAHGVANATANKEQAEAACSAADAARNSAAAVGMEWRDTKKMIEKANEAIESGDFELALKQCDAAKFQGEAGVEQAEIEKETWMARVPQ